MGGAVASSVTEATASAETTSGGLAEASAEFGVPLTPRQLAEFHHLRGLLLSWNDRFNLTAITDPVEVERRLFLDALQMLPMLDALTENDAARLLADVGSGAGFPGLALKIARPDLDVVLIEATGKKVAFINHAIAELGLVGATAIHARAEDIGQNRQYRASFDLVTARAVAALPVLVELCLPLLRIGGTALLPKGLDFADELATGRRAAPLVGGRVHSAEVLPGTTTRLVVVTKTAATPARYPRRAGIPAKEPLGGSPRSGPGATATATATARREGTT